MAVAANQMAVAANQMAVAASQMAVAANQMAVAANRMAVLTRHENREVPRIKWHPPHPHRSVCRPEGWPVGGPFGRCE
eukprot:2171184-Pyramimonas_sp.AAC.1